MLEFANGGDLIKIIENGGECAYYVGGCVRDYMLGKSGGDVDIATSASPQKVVELMHENSVAVYETGIQHGTVTAVYKGAHYEITTFRTDGEYNDFRRPESVNFVKSIEEDLSRRDFTVNAMACSLSGEIIDLYGGKKDIENKIIRTVGDADKRFSEDALRIMRALRFASVLGFEIESNTEKALFRNKELLLNVSAERIYNELSKFLCGDNVLSVLDKYRDIIGVVIPELVPCFECVQNTPWHIYNVYEHIINAVAYSKPNPDLRLTMLLHDIGKPAVKKTDENGRDHFKTHAQAGAEIAEKVLKRFKVSTKTLKHIITLVKYHQSVQNVGKINIKRWFNLISPENTFDLLDVRIADLKAHNPEKVQHEIVILENMKTQAREILERGEPYRICDLDVNGNDLKSLGFSGRQVGEKLGQILDKVIDGVLQNEKDEIMDYIKTADGE